MNFSTPSKILKKESVDYKKALKYQEERFEKVKKALFTFLKDNNVEIINEDQILFGEKYLTLHIFADQIKWMFEGRNKSFPVITIEEYIVLIRELYEEEKKAKQLLSNEHNAKYLTEAEILAIVENPKLKFVKSLEQAEEFLKHTLFRVPEANNFIKVVAKRQYNVTDSLGNNLILEKEILLPGYKRLEDYQETLKHIPVKSSIKDYQESYWDVFLRSNAVVQASMVYNPKKELYWRDEYGHCYINSYKEPSWKDEPSYFYMIEKHKNNPLHFSDVNNLLRSFLIHLFPDADVRREVLKWCAFSTVEKLQTYLTMIGSPGIGKTLFVEEFLGYYHGEENLNFPKTIEIKFNDKCAKSTLLYFDEKMMVTLDQYNEMKMYINRKLAFEEKNKPIYMSENFANVVWSCNTKDTMSGMNRDDRRFKIIPVTNHLLIGAPILDKEGNKIGTFTSGIIKQMASDINIKKEFVLLMLSIMDHVHIMRELKEDINTINDNDTRDIIFSESRSMEFTEIIDVLKNVFNDFNEITGKFGNKPMTQEEKETLGTAYMDYIPLSKILPARDGYYTYRVPFAVIRRVIIAKAGKQKPLSLRSFNRHLENMPPKMLKGIPCGGLARNIEIKLTGEDENNFIDNLLPLISKDKEKINLLPKKEIPLKEFFKDFKNPHGEDSSPQEDSEDLAESKNSDSTFSHKDS